jgi:hypothetical protein
MLDIVDFFVYTGIMGLLSTTYINNITTSSGDSGFAVARATKEQAQATRELSKSTQNVADAINKGRVKLSHTRYSELTNKTKLLKSIYSFMDMYVTTVFGITQQDIYTKFMSHMMMHRGVSQYYKGYVGINDRLHMMVDEEERTCNLYVDNELLTVTIPDYIPETDGYANINEDEYNKLLRNEILLETYSKAVEDLPHLCFRLLDFKNNKEIINDSINYWFRYVMEYKTNSHYSTSVGMTMYMSSIKTNNHTWRIETKVGDKIFNLRIT